MWLACATLEEIAEKVELSEKQVSRITDDILDSCPKCQRLAAQYEDVDGKDDWQPPLYDIWNVGPAQNALFSHHQGDRLHE